MCHTHIQCTSDVQHVALMRVTQTGPLGRARPVGGGPGGPIGGGAGPADGAGAGASGRLPINTTPRVALTGSQDGATNHCPDVTPALHATEPFTADSASKGRLRP